MASTTPPNLRPCDCCYTCRFARFDKRHPNRVARARGLCFLPTPVPPWPTRWQPPPAFAHERADGAFPIDDEATFRRVNALIYYGDRLRLGKVSDEALHAEYERLNWLAKHPALPVSWFQVCDAYAKEEENHDPTRPAPGVD